MAERPASASLRQHGLTPRKRLGQNFLRDESVLPRILGAAALDPDDQVLEIGAGTGVLTRALSEAAQRVLAIELDDALYRMLSTAFERVANVELWHGNALDLDACAHFSGPYKLIANIPYYITGPLLRHYLEGECQPLVLVVMVQREVAERIVAEPGRLSLLGISVQFYANARIVSRVARGAFYPVPKVDSAILQLTPYRRSTGSVEERAFFEVARAGFSTRRKQLVNALMNGLRIDREEAAGMLAGAEIDATRRAETLSITEWERLARARLQFGEDRMGSRGKGARAGA
ncbi:MAG: 16S rRNA (adenine(1518)-N(6)/adenine(1519)-N(6))-dimethyltransferase RsmA [Chloroflexota bacterium]